MRKRPLFVGLLRGALKVMPLVAAVSDMPSCMRVMKQPIHQRIHHAIAIDIKAIGRWRQERPH